MKKIISITTIIILCFTLCINAFAADGVATKITSYINFQSTLIEAGENYIITLSPELDNSVNNIYYSGSGSYPSFSKYYTGKLFGENMSNTGGGLSVFVFPFGEYGIQTSLIPKNTPVNINVNIGFSLITGSINQPNVAARLSIRYYDVNNELVYTQNSNNISGNGDFNFNVNLTAESETQIAYMVPYIYFPYIPVSQVGIYRFDLRTFNMTLTVNKTIYQLEQIFFGNKAAQETNDWLEQIEDALAGDGGSPGTDNKRDEADELIDGMDSMEKPSAGEAADSADPFDIVTESQFESFTDVLHSILNQEIIRNMLLLSIIVVLISYVLFGKK